MIQILYRIFYFPPFNKILRTIVKKTNKISPKKIYFPVSGIIHSRAKSGKRVYFSSNATSYVLKQVFWNGLENYEYMNLFQKLIPKFNCYIDIGANVGLYSIMAKANNPTIQIHCFEPAPGIYNVLKKNIEINKYNDINLHKIALSNDSGYVDFFVVKNPKYPFIKNNLAGVGNLKYIPENVVMKKIKVQSSKFDDYINIHDLENKQILVKMDTEGTEDMIIEGMKEFIGLCRPIIICETLFNKIENKLNDLMISHNYSFFNFVNGSIQKVNTIKRDVDNGVTDSFFVPTEKESFFLKTVNHY